MRVRGLAVLDRRTLAARHLLDWRAELLDDLGGEATTSAAQRALVEVATRTKLYLDHVDAVLMAQDSLIVKRTRPTLFADPEGQEGGVPERAPMMVRSHAERG